MRCEIEQEPQGFESRNRIDQVGVIDDQKRAFVAVAASPASRPRNCRSAIGQRQRERRVSHAAELLGQVRHQLGRGKGRKSEVDRHRPQLARQPSCQQGFA